VKIFWYKKKKSNGQLHLIPIDHSYILPDNLSNAWFDWLYWPQAKVHFSKETLAYIARLNIEEDIKILQQLGFSEQSMINLEITTLFLKSAAEKNWNLYDIGKFISTPPTTATVVNGSVVGSKSNSNSNGNRKSQISSSSSAQISLEKLVNEAKTMEGKFQMEEFKKILERFFQGGKIRET